MSNANQPSRSHLVPLADRLSKMPYWLLAIVLLGVLALWRITLSTDYRVIFQAASRGMLTTVFVSVVAYSFALFFGLLLGLMRASKIRILREIASFYVEIVRGLPMLVVLYYIAFVGAPALVAGINWIIGPLVRAGLMGPLSIRQMDFVWRAILALTIGYSAFISEIFRAGIESIHRGQMEAALSLGMSRAQAMARVILPQAIRNVLPPLGNEFVAMIKDSALVSALGVQDITQIGKVYSASTFKFFETYNVVAFLYLMMTITLSLLVRLLEKRLSRHRSGDHS
ncbi:MAG TPA: amino acid ABC transporter permease [Spirochaetia bacterium]|nr:amino acid ABC transporter permease [Spirochaetia bacterium]